MSKRGPKLSVSSGYPVQADASAQRGTLLPREKHKHAYDKALVQRYQHMPEIRRIVKHRHLPTAIYKARPEPY